jgi:hypothetical protein
VLLESEIMYRGRPVHSIREYDMTPLEMGPDISELDVTTFNRGSLAAAFNNPLR